MDHSIVNKPNCSNLVRIPEMFEFLIFVATYKIFVVVSWHLINSKYIQASLLEKPIFFKRLTVFKISSNYYDLLGTRLSNHLLSI